MKNTLKSFLSLGKGELCLWGGSVLLVLLSFFLFDRTGYLTLISSLVGVTSLIFNAKGNPVGPILMVLFSIFYGVISFSFAYYGEMITYLGMSLPMAIWALVVWLRNPFEGKRSEVTVGHVGWREILFALGLSAVVTVIFWFLLRALGTANLLPSTLSVTTSFLAAYLTARRSPYYALAYAANDVVLMVLWVMASFTDLSYLSVVVCFAVFLVNDLYGFFRWRWMEKQQKRKDNRE